MTWMRPLGLWLGPSLLLAVGVLVILSDGLGLESFLSNQLFDAYRHAAPASARHAVARGPAAHGLIGPRIIRATCPNHPQHPQRQTGAPS